MQTNRRRLTSGGACRAREVSTVAFSSSSSSSSSSKSDASSSSSSSAAWWWLCAAEEAEEGQSLTPLKLQRRKAGGQVSGSTRRSFISPILVLGGTAISTLTPSCCAKRKLWVGEVGGWVGVGVGCGANRYMRHACFCAENGVGGGDVSYRSLRELAGVPCRRGGAMLVSCVVAAVWSAEVVVWCAGRRGGRRRRRCVK